MEAFKFETTVLEDGTIKIPQLKEFVNKKIELFFVIKTNDKENKDKKKSIVEFLDEWTGFFSEIETDDFRYNRIMEKYK